MPDAGRWNAPAAGHRALRAVKQRRHSSAVAWEVIDCCRWSQYGDVPSPKACAGRVSIVTTYVACQPVSCSRRRRWCPPQTTCLPRAAQPGVLQTVSEQRASRARSSMGEDPRSARHAASAEPGRPGALGFISCSKGMRQAHGAFTCKETSNMSTTRRIGSSRRPSFAATTSCCKSSAPAGASVLGWASSLRSRAAMLPEYPTNVLVLVSGVF